MDWDKDIFYAINGLAGQSSVLDHVMLFLSPPGNLLFPIILAVGYWLWKNWREALIGSAFLGGLIAFADFVGAQIKHAVARPRPCKALENVQELVGCGGTFSFPSNHAVNTATAAAFFQVLYPRTGWISWPLVGLIGISRVYLGGHYLTDVFGGWVLGGLLGTAVGIFLIRWSVFRPQASGDLGVEAQSIPSVNGGVGEELRDGPSPRSEG